MDEHKHKNEKRIVVVGAGFGGLRAALTLAQSRIPQRHSYEIVIVDRHHHHLYTPGLYEIAAIPREYLDDRSLASSLLIPLKEIVRGHAITLIRDEAIGLDARTRELMLRGRGVLPYDYLVFALGSETNYFGIPGLEQHSTPLKTCDDAVALRNKIETALKEKSALNIIVGGAGSSGVELAAELINFICVLKEKIVPGSLVCNVMLSLVEASPEILPDFNPWITARAARRLTDLGIAVRRGAAIARADSDAVAFADGTRQPFDILIWTGGVRGPAFLKNLGLKTSPKGTLIVDDDLSVPDTGGRVFAVGDNAWYVDARTGRALPWNASVAEAEGRHAARAIQRAIRGQKPASFRPLLRYPFILAVGKKYALADLVFIRMSGWLGWCVKQLVELRYLGSILPWPRAFMRWQNNVRMFASND